MSNQINDIPEGFKMTELGPLPEEWEVVRMADIVTTVKGRKPANLTQVSEKDYSPYLTAEYFRTSTPTEFVQPQSYGSFIEVNQDDIVFIWDGSNAGDVFTGLKGVWASTMIRILPRAEVLYKTYLYFYLKTQFELFNSKTTGSTIPHVNKELFRNLPIPLPSLSEQKAIAGVLSTIQQSIAAQDKVIAATRKLKKSLMKHLFTYGPVPVAEVGNVPLKETEIGPVPEHWKVVRLGDITAQELRNGAFVRRNRFGDGVPFINVADTYEHISIDLRSSDRVQATEDELRLYSIETNDLFYVRSSLKREGVGQCCIVENVSEPSIYDCHLMQVRVDATKVIPKYLAYFSVSPQGKRSLVARSKTTTMTTINQQGLASFVLPLPPYHIQQRIVDILASADSGIRVAVKRKAALQTMFKTMLHNLMTGKVRVKDLGV